MPLDKNLSTYAPTPLEPTDYVGIRSALDRDGVCVVQNIMTTAEQEKFLDLFWMSVERRQKSLKRHDASTWTAKNTDWYGTFGAGQYKHYGMAQEAHCWLVRSNKVIRDIFEKGFYSEFQLGTGCTDVGSAAADNRCTPCCVSLDGCAAMFRPAVSGLKLHVDLVPNIPGGPTIALEGDTATATSSATTAAASASGTRAGTESESEVKAATASEGACSAPYVPVLQGAYNLYEVQLLPAPPQAPAQASLGGSTTASTTGAPRYANAGFVCVVGSHKHYHQMWRERLQREPQGSKPRTKHWHALEEDSPLQQECSLILSPPNSFVLWRSDLLHKNYGGDADFSSQPAPPSTAASTTATGGGTTSTAASTAVQATPRLARLTQFVTYYPSAFRSAEVLSKKADAVLKGAAMNHWASYAHGSREPIVPFPAWCESAKAITPVIPDVRTVLRAIGVDEDEGDGDASGGNAAARDTAAKAQDREGYSKRRKLNDDSIAKLPRAVRSLL